MKYPATKKAIVEMKKLSIEGCYRIGTMIDSGHDDAQRRLEQRALRNVRDLVDKLEAGDRGSGHRAVSDVATMVLIGVVVLVGAFLAAILWSKLSPRPAPIAFTLPANPAPALVARIRERARQLPAEAQPTFVYNYPAPEYPLDGYL